VLLVYENKTTERTLAWIISCLAGVVGVAIWGYFSAPITLQHFDAKSLTSTLAAEVFIPPAPQNTPPTPTPTEVTPEPTAPSPSIPVPVIPPIAEALPSLAQPVQPTLIGVKAFQANLRPTATALKPTAFNTNDHGGTFPIPPYPRWARQQGMQGEIKLLADIAPDGTITDLKIKESSGFNLLDQHVLDWVKAHWNWVPGSHRLYIIPFIYELQ
jgi:protein TonB